MMIIDKWCQHLLEDNFQQSGSNILSRMLYEHPKPSENEQVTICFIIHQDIKNQLQHTRWSLTGAILPLINERDEFDDVTAELDADALPEASLPVDPELTLRPKTWTVPLSLETASHCAVDEKAKLWISALSAPLLTCICFCRLESSICFRIMTKTNCNCIHSNL